MQAGLGSQPSEAHVNLKSHIMKSDSEWGKPADIRAMTYSLHIPVSPIFSIPNVPSLLVKM